MKFLLDDYIEKYIQESDDPADKTTAQHLKSIIPKTTHLDKNVFNEIIEELKLMMEEGKSFKKAFLQVCKKYILIGDVIKAELPSILTRIILNESKFLKEVAKSLSIAPDLEESIDFLIEPEDLINAIDSKNKCEIKKNIWRFKTAQQKRTGFCNI